MDGVYGNYDYADSSALLAQYSEPENNSFKWQLDPVDVLNEIEMQLRGLEFRDNKIKRFRDPLMNSRGIGCIKVILRGHLHPSNALSDITKEEAYNVTFGCAELINDQLLINGELWVVKDGDKTIINNLIEDAVFLFLMRPVGGKERERLTRTYQLRDMPQRQPQIKGMFDTANSQRGGGNSGSF